MARQKSGDRLETVLRAKAALDAELKRLQAIKRERDKAALERRMKLAGRVVLELLESEPASALSGEVRQLLAAKLTRQGEKALFGALLDEQRPETAAAEAAAAYQSA